MQETRQYGAHELSDVDEEDDDGVEGEGEESEGGESEESEADYCDVEEAVTEEEIAEVETAKEHRSGTGRRWRSGSSRVAAGAVRAAAAASSAGSAGAMELTLWQPSGVPTISWDYEVGFWEQARNYRGEVPWHIVLPVMVIMIATTVMITFWACRAIYQFAQCIYEGVRELAHKPAPKPETADAFTQCTELTFECFEICVTHSGKRYHTSRCNYVGNAVQDRIAYYAKCPSCASLDRQEVNRIQQEAEEAELAPGLV